MTSEPRSLSVLDMIELVGPGPLDETLAGLQARVRQWAATDPVAPPPAAARSAFCSALEMAVERQAFAVAEATERACRAALLLTAPDQWHRLHMVGTVGVLDRLAPWEAPACRVDDLVRGEPAWLGSPCPGGRPWEICDASDCGVDENGEGCVHG